MDAINHCLQLVPIPYLSSAFSLFTLIYSSIDQVQGSRKQLNVLAKCVSQLLITINANYKPGKGSLNTTTAATLDDLSRHVLKVIIDRLLCH
jgi:hypothetical protein